MYNVYEAIQINSPDAALFYKIYHTTYVDLSRKSQTISL